MGNSAITGINLGVPAYIQTFDSGDGASVALNHNLNSQYVSVTVYDNTGKIIIPDDVTATSTTVATLDMTSYNPVSGTWRAVVVDTGATAYIDGNVITSSGIITDNAVPRGDGGSRGVQDSTLLISDNNEVTNANQPAFLARNNAAQNNMAVGSSVDIVFGAEVFDRGSNFASNVFTAPVTGLYHLEFSLNLTNIDSAATSYNIQIFTTARSYRFVLDPRQFAGDIVGKYAISNSVLADMTATDTAKITFDQAGGSAQTDIVDNNDATFSGYLVA